jgi:hypothetical protein
VYPRDERELHSSRNYQTHRQKLKLTWLYQSQPIKNNFAQAPLVDSMEGRTFGELKLVFWGELESVLWVAFVPAAKMVMGVVYPLGFFALRSP